MKLEAILKKPIALTEKATRMRASANQVMFEVLRDADKLQIREAVEKLFNVKVTSVNTLIMRGKDKRMGKGYAKLQNWKKAIVTLKAGDSIDFFSSNQES